MNLDFEMGDVYRVGTLTHYFEWILKISQKNLPPKLPPTTIPYSIYQLFNGFENKPGLSTTNYNRHVTFLVKSFLINTALPYTIQSMNTVIETNIFSAKAAKTWTTEEYQDFVSHIAKNPLAGTVVPGSGGVRKVRWYKDGTGKRGGVRIVYFNTSANQTWLLVMYVKNERENIPAHELKKIKEAIDG